VIFYLPDTSRRDTPQKAKLTSLSETSILKTKKTFKAGTVMVPFEGLLKPSDYLPSTSQLASP